MYKYLVYGITDYIGITENSMDIDSELSLNSQRPSAASWNLILSFRMNPIKVSPVRVEIQTHDILGPIVVTVGYIKANSG